MPAAQPIAQAAPPVVMGAPPVVMGAPPVVMGQPMGPQPFMAQVPPGMGPGMMMNVLSPFTGQQVQVAIPRGVPPGGQFQVVG